MPCRVGGAFPSLPTRRISSSSTVIHESGPDKRTLGVLRPALPLNHLPTACRPPRPTFNVEPLVRQDLRPTWPVILLRDTGDRRLLAGISGRFSCEICADGKKPAGRREA